MISLFFLFFITVVISDQIILKDKCDYHMFQHINCNDLNIKLEYNATNKVSFISTTQQYCDQFKSNCILEEYYPRLSVIKERHYNGILKSKEYEDDDICMLFIENDGQNNTTINFNLNIICSDVHVNTLSITAILLISGGLFFIVLFIYIIYCKYKENRNEIKELKIQLRQLNEHDQHSVKVYKKMDESVV